MKYLLGLFFIFIYTTQTFASSLAPLCDTVFITRLSQQIELLRTRALENPSYNTRQKGIISLLLFTLTHYREKAIAELGRVRGISERHLQIAIQKAMSESELRARVLNLIENGGTEYEFRHAQVMSKDYLMPTHIINENGITEFKVVELTTSEYGWGLNQIAYYLLGIGLAREI